MSSIKRDVFADEFFFTDNDRINRRNLKLLKQMKVMPDFCIRRRLNWGPECLKLNGACSTIVFVWFAGVTHGCGTRKSRSHAILSRRADVTP